MKSKIEQVIVRLLAVIIRILIATLGIWAGTSMIHTAHPAVPEVGFLAAMGAVSIIQATTWMIMDVIRDDKKDLVVQVDLVWLLY